MNQPDRDDDEGFALVSTLVFAIIISSILIALQIMVRSLAQEASSVSDEAEIRAALSAGLNRMIYAYVAPDDPLRAQLKPDGRQVSWSFQGKTLRLMVQAESGKWDLNSGDLSQIVSLVQRLTESDVLRSRIVGNIERARSTRTPLASAISVLPPFERMTEFRETFETHFTVATEQFGIDPSTAPLRILEGLTDITEAERASLIRARTERPELQESATQLGRHFVVEKPIYMFRAQTAEGFRRAGAMQSLVRFPEQSPPLIFSWERSSVIPEVTSNGLLTSFALSPR